MLKQILNKGISTPIAIGIILILVVVVGGFTWWQYAEIRKEESNIPEVQIPEKTVPIQELLSDKEVNEILKEFAEKKTIRFNDVGAGKVLLDALELKDGEIKDQLQSVKINIENLSNEIQDAPDMRSWFTQRVKICIAESIIYNNIKSVLKYCGYKEAMEPIDLTAVDDITAAEQILPYFLAGFAYYSENNYSKADYYYGQIKLHYAELEKYGYTNASYLSLYNKIYNKIKEAEKTEEVKNFEECVAKGYPTLESYPRQCKTPDGETFVEEIKEEIEIPVFDYPEEWGELTFKSQKNEEYSFNSSNKLIIEIKYYKTTKILAFITKGTIYREAKEQSGEYRMPDESEVCDYILKVIYPNGEIKTVYTEENKPSVINGKVSYPYFGGTSIGGISLSPNGKYIGLHWSAYEISGSYLLNIDTGVDILKSYPIWDGDVYWSPDNETLLIRSYHNDFGGEGKDGIFVSDYGNPEKLNEISALNWENHLCNSHFENIKFITNDKFSFSLVLKEGGYENEELKCNEEKIIEYGYDIKTKELKEIK